MKLRITYLLSFIVVFLWSCNKEEGLFSYSEGHGTGESQQQKLRFTVSAPANVRNEGSLRYSFIDGDTLGIFGIPFVSGSATDESLDMSAITDTALFGRDLFNAAYIYDSGSNELVAEKEVIFSGAENMSYAFYAYYPYRDYGTERYGLMYSKAYGCWGLEFLLDAENLCLMPDFLYSGPLPEKVDFRETKDGVVFRDGMKHAMGAVNISFVTEDRNSAENIQLTSLYIQNLYTLVNGFISVKDGTIFGDFYDEYAPFHLGISESKPFDIPYMESGTDDYVAPTASFVLPGGSSFEEVHVYYKDKNSTSETFVHKRVYRGEVKVETGKIVQMKFVVNPVESKSVCNKQDDLDFNATLTIRDWK